MQQVMLKYFSFHLLDAPAIEKVIQELSEKSYHHYY